MHALHTIDAAEFVTRVRPPLQTNDWPQLVETLNAHWTPDQIITLLTTSDADVRKIAALSIGLVGSTCSLPHLAERLHDTDPMVVQMAEHALWQIWFRSGTPEANCDVARGAEALNHHELETAFGHLNRAIQSCPNFAEAYNQRATAYYMGDCFENSIADSEHAVRLMPLHFGAWATMGHAHLALLHRQEALEAYQHALAVNPHLECIGELIDELKNEELKNARGPG